MVVTSSTVFVEAHIVLPLIAVIGVIHVSTRIVATVFGRSLTTSEYKVVTLSSISVPNRVAVGVGLHAMLVAAGCKSQSSLSDEPLEG